MAKLNENITTSWNGLSGDTVQENIMNLFSLNVSAINKCVTNIAFEKDAEKSDRVNYTVTYADGTTDSTNRYFEITSPSQMSISLCSFSMDSYVEPGDDLDITYSYKIFDEDSVLVSGKRPDVAITITNGTYSKTLTTKALASYSNSARVNTYTIGSSYLKLGVNNISINITYTSTDGTASMTADDGVESSVNVLSFTAKIKDVSLTGASVSSMLDEVDSTFGVSFSVVDSNNKNLLTGEGYKTYLPSSSVKTYVLNLSLANLATTTGSTTVTGLLPKTIETSNTNGLYTLYILVRITIGTHTIYSNVCKIVLVVKSLMSSYVRWSYIIPDFSNYTDYDIVTSGDTINASQYDSVNMEVYAYIPTTTTVTHSINQVEINSTEYTGKTDQLLDVSISNYLLTDSGSNYFSIGVGTTTLGRTYNTTSVGSGMTAPSDYVINLSSNGKSGYSESWGLGSDGKSLTSFSGFDWSGNGWVDNALVVNNNATAIINCTPCNNTIGTTTSGTVITGRTAIFRFKTSNENTEEELIKCYQQNCDGFVIYPQKAIVYKGTSAIETKFTSEDNVKEIAFVWYNSSYGNVTMIYIDGVSQCVFSGGSSTLNTSNITITANDTTLYLYNVCTYERALTFNEIQALYNTHKATDVTSYITANSIFSDTVSIGNNGLKVTIDSLPVGSKYILIKAHENGTDRPWEAINNLDATKSVEGKDVETKSWRILCGNTYLITKVAEGEDADEYNFFADKIALSGQGTSSMGYPIKNFRIYLAKGITKASSTGNQEGFGDGYDLEADGAYSKTTVFVTGSEVTDTSYTSTTSGKIYYSMRKGSVPANVFCLKADYAESSGLHNTGFARLANKVMEESESIYANESLKLPLNYVDEHDTKYTFRSTIDGESVYLFFADHAGDITYHGKYNFNNEKASAEVFGFRPVSKKLKAEQAPSETNYFDNSVVKNESNVLKSLFGLDDDNTDYEDMHEKYIGSDQVTYINPTECWEFSTNNASLLEHDSLIGSTPLKQIGAFTFPYVAENDVVLSGYPYSNNTTYKNLKLNPFTEKTTITDSPLAWIDTEQAWEFRFPDDDNITAKAEAGTTPYVLRSLYKWVHRNNVYCWDTDKESHAATFAKYLSYYFNVNYLLKYYVMTKLFINADLRVKNCMIAFYCDPNCLDDDPTNHSGMGNSGSISGTKDCPMGHMRAYYIFYDNDTILGVTNTGALANPWNADETHDVFQGIDDDDVSYHGIWGNIEYCYNQYLNNTSNTDIYNLGKMVESAYAAVRGVASDSNISEYIGNDLPDAAQNVDFEVKYGYPETIAPESTNFSDGQLEQYQGNRKAHRDWLLSKRTKWFDAKYAGGNIKNYSIVFKTQAAHMTLASNKVNVTSAFDEWKFYYLGSEQGNGTPTALLNTGDTGTLYHTGLVNSFESMYYALYGASKIDFSGMYGNDESSYLTTVSTKGTFPYLTEFIMGNDSSSNKIYIASSQLNSFYKSAMPNLERITLLNIGAENSYTSFTVDLSNLKKLKYINTTGTKIGEITLPSGSYLQELYLEAPSKLTLDSKINLTALTVSDVSQLNYITISHCSDVVYKWAAQTAYDRRSDMSSFSMVFGKGTDRDTISESTVSVLVKIANAIKADSTLASKISVSGYAYCSAITTDLLSVLTDVFGDGLNISNSQSKVFAFTYDAGTTLKENSTLTIGTTVAVDLDEDSARDWTLNIVSDPDDISSKISISSKAAYGCTLSADTISDNTDHTVSFTLTTKVDGESYTTDVLTARYIPISSISITSKVGSTETNIVDTNATLILDLGSNSTKSHLINKTNIENGSIAIKATTGSISYNYNTDNTLKSITYTVAGTSDSTVTVLLFSITSSINLYYNNVICTLSDSQTMVDGVLDTTLMWLIDLFNGYTEKLSNSNQITRKDLSKYKISCSGGTIYSNINNANKVYILANEVYEYDLSNLEYFDTETAFIVPSLFKFTNLNIPEGAETVDFSSPYTDYTGYKTINIPSTVSKVRVSLAVTNIPTSLKFDISLATKITKIYNTSATTVSSVPDGVFSLYIQSGSTPSANSNCLFTYNNNITLIGEYSATIGSSRNLPGSLMFNIDGYSSASGSFVPLYSLGAPTNTSGINIGAISSYIMSSPVFDWSTIASYVTGLYFTFFKGSGVTTGTTFQFSKVTHIGDCSFCELGSKTVTFVFGSNVLTIGYSAFYNCEAATILANSKSIASFPNVTRISSSAFSELGISTKFEFNNLEYIGEYVFTIIDTLSHTINLACTNASISVASTDSCPFGTKKRNKLYLVTDIENVQTTFKKYANDVLLFINGTEYTTE